MPSMHDDGIALRSAYAWSNTRALRGPASGPRGASRWPLPSLELGPPSPSLPPPPQPARASTMIDSHPRKFLIAGQYLMIRSLSLAHLGGEASPPPSPVRGSREKHALPLLAANGLTPLHGATSF